MKLACQEHILPGEDILEKWEFASEAGFDGIELHGTEAWLGRLDDLWSARDQGVVFSSVDAGAAGGGGARLADFGPSAYRRYRDAGSAFRGGRRSVS